MAVSKSWSEAVAEVRAVRFTKACGIIATFIVHSVRDQHYPPALSGSRWLILPAMRAVLLRRVALRVLEVDLRNFTYKILYKTRKKIYRENVTNKSKRGEAKQRKYGAFSSGFPKMVKRHFLVCAKPTSVTKLIVKAVSSSVCNTRAVRHDNGG